MFAALDDEDASTLYWSFAFIYALPYLVRLFWAGGGKGGRLLGERSVPGGSMHGTAGPACNISSWHLPSPPLLPWQGNGFQLDGFAIVSLLVCILHVQVGGRAWL